MQTAALIIFIITYTDIIFTRLPKMNIDRPSAVFFGAVAMILFVFITFDESKGVKIRFMEFFRIGIVVTIISMALSFGIIYLEMQFL